MAYFNLALPIIQKNEGGYANVAGDTGGQTYVGISRNNFPDWSGWAIIDAMNPPPEHNQIIPELTPLLGDFYKPNFWDKIQGDNIASQPIASYFMDWFVTSGAWATKHVQKILNIAQDGIFGTNSVSALNNAGDILSQIHDARVAYYTAIAANGNEKFLTGWLNRADDTYAALLSA